MLPFLHSIVTSSGAKRSYLSYIIDYYHALSDISAFVHAHQHFAHMEDLLDGFVVDTIKRLSLAKAVKDGYFNPRCNWEYGCPSGSTLPTRSFLY
jgi:hypothetical protein